MDEVKEILGDPTCVDSYTAIGFNSLLLPLVGAILAVILCLPCVSFWIDGFCRSLAIGLMVRFLIVFFVLLLLDSIISNWRKSNVICEK